MSTSYYRLAEPVTSIRVEDAGSHKKVSIWTNHGLSGTLAVRSEDSSDFLYLLRKHGDSAVHSYLSGTDLIVTVNDLHLEDDSILLSDSGKVVTLKEIKDEAKKLNEKQKAAASI